MIFKKKYEGFEIDFEPFLGQRNVMVNATQMANAFGKKVTHFLENESTENFIQACLKSRNSDFLGIKNREDLVSGKQKSGTWMHRVLALKFAAWLNPEFDLWVFMVIEEMLFGFANSQTKSIQRSVELQNRIQELKEKDEKTGDDFKEYIQCEEELLAEKYSRAGIAREKFKEAWDLFNQPKKEE